MDDLLDHCSLHGATRLAERIRRHWRKRGFGAIRAWPEHSGLPVVPSDWNLRAPHYIVASNIQGDGYPPGLPT